MAANRVKQVRRSRRKRRIRKKISGTAERPRLSVTRGLRNIGAQLIDDDGGVTLCQVSTLNKDVRDEVPYGGNKNAAQRVGQLLAERAAGKGITAIAFDRNGYRFHGRLKALADAAREGGLKF